MNFNHPAFRTWISNEYIEANAERLLKIASRRPRAGETGTELELLIEAAVYGRVCWSLSEFSRTLGRAK